MCNICVFCGCPYFLCGKVQSSALAVVRFVDGGSSLQQNLCTVQTVSQHTVHQRGPAKLVLTITQRGICYITHTHIKLEVRGYMLIEKIRVNML